MRSFVRGLLNFAFVVITSPAWLLVRVFGRNGRECEIFSTFGCAFSLVPGRLGVFLRRAYYVMTLDRCADDVGIQFGTWFSKRSVVIEPRVSIGAHCLIGSCRIGSGTLIGSGVHILSGRHQHSVQGETRFTQVSIGSDCWIGNCAIIMENVDAGSTIGAAAVVVHHIHCDAVAVGNPAVVKRYKT